MARLAQGATPFWSGELREKEQDVPAVTFREHHVFVLMPMADNESVEVYRAIKAGCALVDLAAARVDEATGARIIMRDVDKMMGDAEFLIFDLSQERPNVYYELGYAHGIGNHAENILLIAREGTPIAFDIAPLRIQFYRSVDHLQSLVATHLRVMKQRTRAKELSIPTREARPWWRKLFEHGV
jgi:hypothetical protein